MQLFVLGPKRSGGLNESPSEKEGKLACLVRY